MNKDKYNFYVETLKKELVPALGYTELSSIAYGVAIAKKYLGDNPIKIDLFASPNIIKNAKSITVPNTNGEKGVKNAILAGLVAPRANGIYFCDSLCHRRVPG